MPVAPSPSARAPRYEDITESTGSRVTREGASMLYSRYAFAASKAKGGRVLEIGCAGGQGLGLLAKQARSVIGGDYSAVLLRRAQETYGGRFPLAQLSVEALPFRAASFETVIFFEASYYVKDMNRGFDEIARVLSTGGTALFVNANPERPDFIRSPHSHQYHSASEFREALSRRGFDVVVEAAFPTVPADRSVGARVVASVVSFVRRVLERLHLVPKTLRGRALLKRIVYGRLPLVPGELADNYAPMAPRIPVSPSNVRDFKVLYVTATKRPSPSP
jgi:SAM-dependent methyltransferase